jgi:hypothetical protein
VTGAVVGGGVGAGVPGETFALAPPSSAPPIPVGSGSSGAGVPPVVSSGVDVLMMMSIEKIR